MPYQFNYKQYKKSISTPNPSVVPILCVVIIILLGLAFFLNTKKPNLTCFYFVEITNFENYKDANALALEIQNSGGAGYVHFNTNYHVFANFYSKKDQAESVVTNLKSTYSKCCVYTITSNKFINKPKFSNKQNESISNFASSCEKSLSRLADLCIEYDKKIVSYSRLNTEIKGMKSLIQNSQSKFVENFKSNSKFNTAKEYSLEIYNVFDFLSNLEENQTFCSTLKYQMIKLSVNFSCFLNSFA